MEGLVNYSSEDEQDDYPYMKVAVRERGSGSTSGSGRVADVSGSLKRSYENSKSICDDDTSLRKGRCSGNERFKAGNANYNEDKYKLDRRSDNSRDHKEKRENRESKHNRDSVRDDDRDFDYNKRYDYKKIDDHKRHREQRREYKRDANDYYRDDKKYSRYDDRKSMSTTSNKDRFGTSKSRYDDRKHNDDRSNDEKRSTNDERRAGSSITGGTYVDDRKKEFNERRNYSNDDDRRNDRRNEDRRTQRSYIEDRSSTHRPRRSNSPIPSSHHKSNCKYSERKDDTRRERKRLSRSRSRSRSHSGDNSMEPNATSAKSLNQRAIPSEHLGDIKRPEAESQVSEKKTLPTARNFEALLTLPLSDNTPKHPNVGTVPVTSAIVGSNTTAATVQLPSYYNPNVINPNKYVEQMQKRKLIWGAKKTEDSASKWGHAQFSQDQDGKVASKFMRLMGIKHVSCPANGGSENNTSQNESEMKSPLSNTPNNTDMKSREAMFSTMEQQYEVARQVTHTMRGVGLGFGSQSKPF